MPQSHRHPPVPAHRLRAAQCEVCEVVVVKCVMVGGEWDGLEFNVSQGILEGTAQQLPLSSAKASLQRLTEPTHTTQQQLRYQCSSNSVQA